MEIYDWEIIGSDFALEIRVDMKDGRQKKSVIQVRKIFDDQLLHELRELSGFMVDPRDVNEKGKLLLKNLMKFSDNRLIIIMQQ